MNAALVLLLVLQGPSEEEKLKRKVEAAVWRGADYLLSQARNLPYCPAEVRRYDELVLYALVHAGADRGLDAFKKLLDSVVNGPYDKVYTVALRAMSLEAIDASKYKAELLMCALYLVEQQSVDGHWGYGAAMKIERPADDQASPNQSSRAKLIIRRTKRDREKIGDNSNSQYAMLGLRACLKAGIEIEPGVFEDAIAAWERDQRGDGGWGYGRESASGEDSYGSMTAGAIASLIIAREALKKPWKKDARIEKGLSWLSDHWSVREHPKYPDPQKWLHYYFYAVERLGDLMGEEKIGDMEWYAPIRDQLIESQLKDGSWKGTDEMPIADTCFTILFIRRAMKPAPKVSTGGK